MTFFIRCARGHSAFTVIIVGAEDGDGIPTGDQLVLLACKECGEEEVLEISEPEWRRGARKVMETP